MRAMVLVLGLLMSACTLANMTPKARFQDAAYTLNDAARWGQVDIASGYVSPTYLTQFVARHRFWGEQVSIADAELVRMQIEEGNKGASSIVTLNWYDTHGVTVRSSTIVQKWASERGNFKLIEEKVSAGDPSIFAEAEPEATSGSATPAP